MKILSLFSILGLFVLTNALVEEILEADSGMTIAPTIEQEISLLVTEDVDPGTQQAGSSCT